MGLFDDGEVSAKEAEKRPVEPLLTELLGHDIVTVTVGPTSKKYRLHKNLLCYHSTFFNAAFNGKFKEGNDGELSLPQDGVRTFDLFVHWLYRGSLLPLRDPDSAFDHLSLYAMADKWFIPTLQDVVCDQVRTRYMGDLCPLPAFFEHLYNETSPSCKLRQYFVKKFAVYASSLEKDPARITKTLEQNADFAIDVAKEAFLYPRLCGYGPRQIFKDPDILPACDFHVHGRGQPCPSGKFKPESTTAPRPLTVSFN